MRRTPSTPSKEAATPSKVAATPSDAALVAVGVVARSHGLRGEVRLQPLNPGSTLLASQRVLVLRTATSSESGPRSIRVTRIRAEKGAFLAVLEGVETREAADALRGLEVCVPRSAFPTTRADEWYVVDLKGLSARSAEGDPLGAVVDVVQYPTIDCLCVQSADGVREVPMIEPYFLDADVAAGFVTLGTLEGLEVEAPRRPRAPRPAKVRSAAKARPAVAGKPRE
jgi:16S rRNA processing protein RimM